MNMMKAITESRLRPGHVEPDEDGPIFVRALRNHGSREKYNKFVRSPDARLVKLPAAFLRLKPERFDANVGYRRATSLRYRKQLRNPAFRLPTVRICEGSH